MSFSTASQAAFWVTLYSFVWYITAQTAGVETAFARTSLVYCCHLVNFYACYSFLVPRYFENKQYGKAFAGLALLLLLLTPLRLLIERYFLEKNPVIMRQYLTVRSARGMVLFSEISIAAFGSLLRLAVSNDQNKRRLADIERMHLQSELSFLKAQMTPHFLFNTINNIYSLTLVKSDNAPSALMKLSGLLRYLLYECHGQVLVHREIEALRDYAELFQLRYEQPLDLDIDCTILHPDAYIEPMLLIPLLENALKHSGLGIADHAFARVLVSGDKNTLDIHVRNSKSPLRLSLDSGGIGLTNIRKRLEAAYPGRYTLDLRDADDTFTVELKIAHPCP
jgi:LytS/YehU family sensor histidine kinase